MRRVGEWEVEGELARGGAGVVLRAHRVWDGRPAALKLLASAHVRGEHARRRWAREVEALRRMDHPGVVRILAAGEHEGAPFLALEMMPGGSLDARLEAGPLPLFEALEAARQVALALAHVHGCGVVHRDVKPANVVWHAGRACLVDFGLARGPDALHSQERLTREGTLLGTPGYWAPELVRGELEAIGPPADVYGLGATLWALLVGRPPLEGESAWEMAIRAGHLPDPPSRHRPEVPGWVDDLVLRCLQPDPTARPGAAEVAEALELGALGGVPIAPAAPRARAPWRVAAPGLGLGLAALALLPLLLRGRDPAPHSGGGAPATTAPAVPAPAALPAPAPLPAWSEEQYRALQGRAAGLEQEGRADQARALLDEALRGRPGDPRLLTVRGALRARLGDWPLALADAEGAVAGAPEVPQPRALLGWVLLELGQLDRALVELDRALEGDPGAWRTWACRAHTRRRLGDLPGAARDLDRALQVRPDEPGLLFARGAVRMLLEDPPAAREDFQRLVEVTPESRDAWINLAVVLEVLRRPEEAIAACERALALQPEDASALFIRGRCRTALGDAPGGADDLRRALVLAPDHEDAPLARELLAGAGR